jgi:hypothetical protein
MADLLTHMATGLLFKAGTRGPYTAALVAGTVLPDLGARVPAIGFSALAKSGLPIAPEIPYAFEVLHMPLGMALLSLLIACFFREDQRVGVFFNLLGGCLLHLALDVTQDHLGVGYLLGFPFSTADFELGWVGTEATVLWAPLFGLVALVLWRRRLGSAHPDLQEDAPGSL